jgi:Ni/Co efflux regulator RcnB
MLIRRLTVVAFAAVVAVSSSVALLQNAQPALADRDDHGRHAQKHDRDWKRHHKIHFNHGLHNGHYKKHHDPDRDRHHR